MGTEPVAWTNRYENHPNVIPVHSKGDFYIAVTLGAEAAEIARHARVGVVLRVAVLGDEVAGPQHGAPAVEKRHDSAGRADSDGTVGAGWTGPVVAAAVGGAVVLIAGAVLVLVRRRAAAMERTRRSA
ncbi:hypothetical protein AB0J57_12465 [Streptomyces sp. NPDC049837]|uniref:hypothetical protein n=1 Tax=Streptomyces sp. NPDC049837 TaxID=3155277 RepID=UPI00341826A6